MPGCRRGPPLSQRQQDRALPARVEDKSTSSRLWYLASFLVVCLRLRGRFRTAREQRPHSANYYAVYPGNTPENHPPTEACMINSKHMVCKELFERIDASNWILCFMIWVGGEVNCDGACFALHFKCWHMSYLLLSSLLNIAWANCCVYQTKKYPWCTSRACRVQNSGPWARGKSGVGGKECRCMCGCWGGHEAPCRVGGSDMWECGACIIRSFLSTGTPAQCKGFAPPEVLGPFQASIRV